MKLTDSERAHLFRSRGSKPPYTSVRLGVHVTEEFMQTAKELLFDIPDRPFRSVSELVRHATAIGLIHMADHGVPVDKLRDIWHLAQDVDRAYETQQSLNRMVDKAEALVRNAQTDYQTEVALNTIRRTINVCPDKEIVAKLEKLLG